MFSELYFKYSYNPYNSYYVKITYKHHLMISSTYDEDDDDEEDEELKYEILRYL